MKYRFQHFIDISTSAESMQVLQFSVGGPDVIKRCAHLFNAYKYFKLGKISIKFVPASTLPVDPLGMSYDDTDPQTVDPRDQLNPGLVRITNGEDVRTDLTGLSDLQQQGIYEAMMLDPRWYKFNLQSGFKRSAVPLYWQVGQLHQDQYPGAVNNLPAIDSTDSLWGASTVCFSEFKGTGADASGFATSSTYHFDRNYSDPKGFFQVGHRGRIGWLPTDAYQYLWQNVDGSAVGEWSPLVHGVPSIQVITAVLPKAYKTLYYYRCYITEEVSFSGLRSISPGVIVDGVDNTYRGLDNFLVAPNVNAWDPSASWTPTNPAGYPATNQINDGSGDGSGAN